MPQADVPSRRDRALAYTACYGLLLVLLLLDVILLFVWRLTLLILIARYTERSAANSLLYLGPLLLLGMVLFVSLIGAEGYLRDGVERRQLRRRFLRFAVPLIVMLLLALLLQGVAALK